MTPPPTPAQIHFLQRRLLRKGGELAAILAELLAGERPDVMRLLGRGKPGETPIERTRRFLRLVDERLQAVHAGTYGRCVQCGDGLPFAQLEQAPWIDTCEACARKALEVEEEAVPWDGAPAAGAPAPGAVPPDGPSTSTKESG